MALLAITNLEVHYGRIRGTHSVSFAVEEGEVENFLANFVPRTRVKEAIHALLSARELSFVYVGSKSLLQVTPPKQAYVPKPRPERVG